MKRRPHADQYFSQCDAAMQRFIQEFSKPEKYVFERSEPPAELTLNYTAQSFADRISRLTGEPTPPADSCALPAALALTRAFGRFYRIGHDFGHSLADADLNVATKYLPARNQFLCIEFPEGIAFETNGGWIMNAYVAVSDNRDRRVRTKSRKSGEQRDADKLITFFFPVLRKDGTQHPSLLFDRLMIALQEETIEQALQATALDYTETKRTLVAFVSKCLLYIESGNPDLREEMSARKKLNNRKWERFYDANRDASQFDWHLVGYEFKKPRIYSVDETAVKGHYRWQPCGPSREQVKLIWIDEHIRHYGKDQKRMEEAVPHSDPS